MATDKEPTMTIAEEREDLDLRVRFGLLGNAQEQEAAIVLAYDRYKKPLMAYLRKNFAELSSDEIASAVQDTFIAVHDNAQKLGETDEPLSRFLFNVAKRRGIDARRKRARRIQTDDELTEEIAKAVENTLTKLAWERLRLAEKTSGVIEEFRAFATTLKGKQQLVASVLADYMPYLLNDRDIADEIYARKGLIVPTVEIKGAKAALFRKFRELIERRLS